MPDNHESDEDLLARYHITMQLHKTALKRVQRTVGKPSMYKHAAHANEINATLRDLQNLMRAKGIKFPD